MRSFRMPVLLTLCLLAFVQADPIEKIIASFKRYTEELPQEKVYLHLDQPFYSTGDRIWFKAYLVAGTEQIPSPLSRTLYVELFDSKKNLVEQLKLYCPNGSCAGNFLLPETLLTGDYVVRAYTQWMKNFSEDYFYHRNIKIYNYKWEQSSPGAPGTINVQFFPEGGEWVSGFKSKLAFKAVDAFGVGKKISGKILDETGQVVTTFQSNFLGMGSCDLVPKENHSYHAVLDDTSAEIKLPPVLESGITMSVTNRPDQESLVVRIQNSTPEKTVYLIAQSRGVVCHAAKVVMPNVIAFVKIAKEDLITGVVQITLISEAGLPRAERLIFIDHHESLKVKVTSNKEVFAPREKVTLQIEVKSTEGIPVVSDLSMSVTDDGLVPPDKNRESIFSYLYFASELKGDIESSGYYFNSENADRLEALDALLLTQGWRRFSYEKAMGGPWPLPAFLPQHGLTIKGKLIDRVNKKPAAKGKIKYLNTFPFPELKMAITNEVGDFEIPEVVFFDSTNVILQGETRQGEKSVMFVMDTLPNFFPAEFKVLPMKIPGQDIESNFMKESQERKKINDAFIVENKTIALDPVLVKGERKESLSAMKRLYGKPSATIDVANNKGMEFQQHPLQLLQGRVPGVQVSGSGNSWTIQISGVNSIQSGTSPMILVNNVTYDIGSLSGINVRDIESINVYKGADTAIFGMRGTNGVIAFYLKTSTNALPPGQSPNSFRSGAYQSFREFYSPRYDIQRPEHGKPDRRVTLFWEPFIKTDSAGKATVTFYNHDLPTTVTGIVEGMTPAGTVGSQSFHFSINK